MDSQSATATAALSSDHMNLLMDAAVTVDVALEAGAETVADADRLPDSLASFGNLAPGLLFWHHQVDGGDPVPQLRPDDPPVDERGDPTVKYVLPKGSGAVISVHPRMRNRVGSAGRIVIVEGTKQYLAAVSHAADGDLVVGIQGAHNWSSDGVPVAAVDLTEPEGCDVVVCFDGDVTTNRDVYDAAQRLEDHLKMIGAASVAHVKLPAGQKAGLDDYLADRPAANRTAVFARLLGSAGGLGRKPAKKTPVKTPVGVDRTGVVDEEACEIREQPVQVGDEVVAGKRLLGASARIAASVVVQDDLGDVPQETVHTLEVRIGGVAYRVEGVADAELEDPRLWLERLPGAAGTRVMRAPGRSAAEQIAAAVRAYKPDEAETMIWYRRTGWKAVEGQPAYLHHAGAITPDRSVETAGAVTDYRSITYPDPHSLASVEVVDAVRASLSIGDELADPTAWFALIGAMAFAHTGARPSSCLFLLGGHGTGKTALAQTAFAHLSPKYAYRGMPMATMDGTATAVAEAGVGLHHCVIGVDDARRKAHPREQEAQDRALDGLVRRSYGGGAAGRDRMRVNRSASGPAVQRAQASPTSPMVIITGEVLPSAADARSTVERIASVQVKPRSISSDPSDHRLLNWMVEVASDGTLNRAWAAFLGWLAGQVDQFTVDGDADMAIRSWVSHTGVRRGEVERHLAEVPELEVFSHRVREVVAPLVYGWMVWCQFARDVGAIGHDRYGELISDMIHKVVASQTEHASVELSDMGANPAETLLDFLKQTVASGRYVVTDQEGMSVQGPQVRLGHTTTVAGADGEQVEVVAVVPSVAAEASRTNAEQVTRSLRPVAVHDPSGRSTRVVRIDGHSTRCVCVPKQVWDDPHATVLSHTNVNSGPGDGERM